MSLLHKTILSFFPSEAHCAFVEEPWFLKNYELQLDVLRLCQMGFAKLLFTPLDRQTFTQHVMCCMRRYIDDTYYPNNRTYYAEFIEYLTTGITYGDYLLTRSWFCGETTYRHVNLFLIELNGCSYLVNPVAGDFDEHIYSLMDSIVWCYEIYGQCTRTMIVEGDCIGFFNQRIINNDIHGANYIIRQRSRDLPPSIWVYPPSDDENDDDEEYENYDDYDMNQHEDVFMDYYECRNEFTQRFYNDFDDSGEFDDSADIGGLNFQHLKLA